MWAFIRKWFQDRKQEREAALYRAGYDNAAGALLGGFTTQEGLEQSVEQSHALNVFNAFDQGTLDAIEAFEALKSELMFYKGPMR